TMSHSVDTTAYRFFIRAGYLFGLLRDRLQIGANVGYEYEAFKLGSNTTMPSALYSQVRIGLPVLVSLVGDLLYLQFDPGLRFLLSMGDLGDAFGQSHSFPVGKSFDINFGLGGALPIGFAYRLEGGFRRYAFEFSGMGSDAAGSSGSDKGWFINMGVG